jgi:cytoskeletal protein CcmA (bactofilin family)
MAADKGLFRIFRRSAEKRQPQVNAMARTKLEKGVTLIAATTEISGDIRFKDQLYVNGRIEGNVISDEEGATVIISDSGCVAGEIRVPNVVINGQVEGNVFAAARVELAAKARVTGNVYYQLIEMHLGAMVDGQLLHDQTRTGATVHQLAAENGASAESSRERQAN